MEFGELGLYVYELATSEYLGMPIFKMCTLQCVIITNVTKCALLDSVLISPV
jgi:hypothetical protein